jgi:hypothetical protein
MAQLVESEVDQSEQRHPSTTHEGDPTKEEADEHPTQVPGPVKRAARHGQAIGIAGSSMNHNTGKGGA